MSLFAKNCVSDRELGAGALLGIEFKSRSFTKSVFLFNPFPHINYDSLVVFPMEILII